MSVIATWSGGKDSCFAAYKAMQAGYTVKYLANTVSQQYRRVGFHGVEARIIQKQADCIGIPLLQQETTAATYWDDFTNNLQKASSDIDGVIFGDIFLEECLGASKKICERLGVSLIEPLWKIPSITILNEFIEAGFEAVVVSSQASLFGKDLVGRMIDSSFIMDIQKMKGVDPCGENGEYHSLVVNGPIFKKAIHIEQSQSILRNGYWFLDIQKYSVS